MLSVPRLLYIWCHDACAVVLCRLRVFSINALMAKIASIRVDSAILCTQNFCTDYLPDF